MAALEAAAELAARTEAELLGLFVEDMNLLRLAGLPFAREVGFLSPSARRLDALEMERSLRALAEQSRQALALAAERSQVKWSFRVVRGEVAEEVLAAAREVDIVSVGRAGSEPLRVRLGSTARAVVSRAPRHVLVTAGGVPLRRRVQVLYDGSPEAVKALVTAARLVEKEDGLTVLIPAGAAVPQQLEQEAARRLKGYGVSAAFRRVDSSDLAGLLEAVQAGEDGVLVLGASSLPPEEAGLPRLLERLECPVLLVR
jgi:nucleotide-binding universal stress UspA family protein